MKAIWATDYDCRTDQTFNRPSCPECRVPIGKDEDGKYYCFSCGKEVDVSDRKIKKWFAKREKTKVKIKDHPIIKGRDVISGKEITYGCGGKKCFEEHYRRNKVTLKWEVGWAECRECGAKIIV